MAEQSMLDGVREVSVTRVGPVGRRTESDVAAAEEPLEVRVNGRPVAVIMRTPGADSELAVGFLLGEGVIHAGADLGQIRIQQEVSRGARGSIVNVVLPPERARSDERRRLVVMNSSCGLCGRLTLDNVRVHAPRLAAEWSIPARLITDLPERLRMGQEAFIRTGGLHAAGLFDSRGVLDAMAEDVGRHNAVDKIVGRMLLAGRLPLSDYLLFVSGRTSYELVQKAAVAGVPVLAAVSAPSSLAIQLAAEAGITLLGFVRGASFNVYTHQHRIA